jgi:hypothetical protein
LLTIAFQTDVVQLERRKEIRERTTGLTYQSAQSPEAEIEAVLHKATQDPTSLAPGEQALIFAIYFIATLSLTEEQCIHLPHSNKIQLLETFQKAVEESLVIAEFVVTSDRFVLQAFMLYLVGILP